MTKREQIGSITKHHLYLLNDLKKNHDKRISIPSKIATELIAFFIIHVFANSQKNIILLDNCYTYRTVISKCTSI